MFAKMCCILDELNFRIKHDLAMLIDEYFTSLSKKTIKYWIYISLPFDFDDYQNSPDFGSGQKRCGDYTGMQRGRGRFTVLHIIDFSPRLVHCSAGCRCIHNKVQIKNTRIKLRISMDMSFLLFIV